MKKFLTLALALVMALALAAPAMAFVDFEYAADSDYALDFYLVDYDESYKVFNSTGVFTELPAADRGYVKNEMVGAVVEVLVPAGAAANKVDLKITGSNVALASNEGDAISSRDVTNKLVGTTNTKYVWDWVAADEELLLDTAQVLTAGPAALDEFVNASATKDVTAAWLVFAKVLDDEASITATLYNDAVNYNRKLATSTLADNDKTATYQIGSNKYLVTLRAVPSTTNNAVVGSYVYEITKETPDGNIVYIYTDADFKTEAMVATNGSLSVVDDLSQTATDKARYVISFGDAAGFAANWVAGASMTLNGVQIDYGTTTDTTAELVRVIQAAVDETLTNWTFGAGNAWSVAIEAKNGGPVGGAAANGNTPPPSLINISVPSGATVSFDNGSYVQGVSAGASYFLVGEGGNLYNAIYGNNPPTTAQLLRKPVQGALTAASGAGVVFLNDVLADFNMNPALRGNILKPEYLGQYRSGNVIDEITLNIEPWQAYVTIPDIEVIDPPKTGDAATLAGFVMIVLAAAGVVVFRKVRA